MNFMENTLNKYLEEFSPISLAEMDSVRLMNRIDTKFVTSYDNFIKLIPFLKENYYLQDIDGRRYGFYHTIYYDTQGFDMYLNHHNGRKTRKKVRMREYTESRECFLEVKLKNNKGRTAKKRIRVPAEEENYLFASDAEPFLQNTALYHNKDLLAHLENNFDRITMVNKAKTERLTIDMNLSFNNFVTDKKIQIRNLVVIELKQDGNQPSPLKSILSDYRIQKQSFSKYCVGAALTNSELKSNRFKKNFINLEKLSKYQNDFLNLI